MTSFTRKDYQEVYEVLRDLYALGVQTRRRPHFRVPDYLADRARRLAIKVEDCIGQVDAMPASCWREIPTQTPDKGEKQ